MPRIARLVLCGPALKHLRRLAADIVFLDPPYELESEYRQALRLLAERAARPGDRAALRASEPGGSLRPPAATRVLKQGDNVLSFFEPPVKRSSARSRSRFCAKLPTEPRP